MPKTYHCSSTPAASVNCECAAHFSRSIYNYNIWAMVSYVAREREREGTAQRGLVQLIRIDRRAHYFGFLGLVPL